MALIKITALKPIIPIQSRTDIWMSFDFKLYIYTHFYGFIFYFNIILIVSFKEYSKII